MIHRQAEGVAIAHEELLDLVADSLGRVFEILERLGERTHAETSGRGNMSQYTHLFQLQPMVACRISASASEGGR